jgi:hypothetical protein
MIIGWFWTGIVKFRFSLPGMQALIITARIFIPGMSDIFFDLFTIPTIDFMNFIEITI